mgnify:CR=1 FL=1
MEVTLPVPTTYPMMKKAGPKSFSFVFILSEKERRVASMFLIFVFNDGEVNFYLNCIPIDFANIYIINEAFRYANNGVINDASIRML